MKVLGRRTVLRATAPDCRPPLPGITPDSDADDADAEVIETELEMERFMESAWVLVLVCVFVCVYVIERFINTRKQCISNLRKLHKVMRSTY